MFYKEDYISLKTAKLLKIKGFNEPCEKKINIDTGFISDCDYDHICYINSVLSESECSCPTLYEVEKWLRKNYNCIITTNVEFYTNGTNYLFQVLFYDENGYDCISDKSSGLYGDNGEYKSYEECLDAAIIEAIKHI